MSAQPWSIVLAVAQRYARNGHRSFEGPLSWVWPWLHGGDIEALVKESPATVADEIEADRLAMAELEGIDPEDVDVPEWMYT